MMYVLIKFRNMPEPIVMSTMHIEHASMLSTMDEVEWVSPTISNGNALACRRPTGGDVLEGAHDYYISAYRPKEPQEEFSQENQEKLAQEPDLWTSPEPKQHGDGNGTHVVKGKMGFFR